MIDKGLVRELEIDENAKYVYFGRSTASKDCRATEQENLYRLVIRAPFSNCGTQVIVSIQCPRVVAGWVAGYDDLFTITLTLTLQHKTDATGMYSNVM